MSFRNILPKVNAQEEDLVDPLDELKEKCGEEPHAKHLKQLLDECNERVRSKTFTAETCTPELLDLLHEINHCVHKDLWKHLK